MIVCEISLESKCEMFIDVEFQTASESIKVSPIRFLSGRRELTYHELCDRVGRTRGCDDLQGAQIGSNEERDGLKMTERKIWADLEGLCLGVDGDTQLVTGRYQTYRRQVVQLCC